MENNNNVNVTNESNEKNTVGKKLSLIVAIILGVPWAITKNIILSCIIITIFASICGNEVEQSNSIEQDVVVENAAIEDAYNDIEVEEISVEKDTMEETVIENTYNDIAEEAVNTSDNIYSDNETTDVESDAVDIWFDGKSSYMMDTYVVDYGNFSENEIYTCIKNAYSFYTYGYTFYDFRDYSATSKINDLMRTNDNFIPIIIEGEILNIEGQGNIIEIYDMRTTEENIYISQNGIDATSLNCIIDISMVDNKDEFFVNDNVTIYANYCGRLNTTSGSYKPLIVAVAVELQ